MNDCNRFNETKLPSIKDHYSNLDLENITNEDHMHAKNAWNTFKINNLADLLSTSLPL